MHIIGKLITTPRWGFFSSVAKFPRRAARGVLAWALLASVLTATAADSAPRAGGDDQLPAGAELVKPGLYRVGGSVLRVGSKGLIVVDPDGARNYGDLMAAIRRIPGTADKPIGALVVIAAGLEQAGNAARFTDARAKVIVQQRAVSQLVVPARVSGAAAPQPLITYDTDYMLRVDDLEAEVEHVGRGRTGADSVVFFRDLRVLAVGELFAHGTPEPDCASGGSYAAWAAAITHLLFFDFDVAVPSRGAAVGKHEVLALKARLEALAASADSPAGCRPPR